jgi:hypothetical protein
MLPSVCEKRRHLHLEQGTTPLCQSITTGMALPIKYVTQAKNNTSA